jgi:hypothetical protein
MLIRLTSPVSRFRNGCHAKPMSAVEPRVVLIQRHPPKIGLISPTVFLPT